MATGRSNRVEIDELLTPGRARDLGPGWPDVARLLETLRGEPTPDERADEDQAIVSIAALIRAQPLGAKTRAPRPQSGRSRPLSGKVAAAVIAAAFAATGSLVIGGTLPNSVGRSASALPGGFQFQRHPRPAEGTSPIPSPLTEWRGEIGTRLSVQPRAVQTPTGTRARTGSHGTTQGSHPGSSGSSKNGTGKSGNGGNQPPTQGGQDADSGKTRGGDQGQGKDYGKGNDSGAGRSADHRGVKTKSTTKRDTSIKGRGGSHNGSRRQR